MDHQSIDKGSKRWRAEAYCLAEVRSMHRFSSPTQRPQHDRCKALVSHDTRRHPSPLTLSIQAPEYVLAIGK